MGDTMEESFQKFLKMRERQNRVIKNPGYEEVFKITGKLKLDERIGMNPPRGEFKDSENLISRYIHMQEEEPVGYIDAYRLNGKRMALAELKMAIDPEFRGRKITKVLLEEIFKLVKDKGVKKVLMKIKKEDKKMKRVAVRNGFRQEGMNSEELLFSRFV